MNEHSFIFGGASPFWRRNKLNYYNDLVVFGVFRQGSLTLGTKNAI